MRNILCFGDSNTFGTNPSGGRWERKKRWPGILQELLGEDYHIIEEGCGGRTTVREDDLEPDKNGRTALRIALNAHKPLDLVILMLGTNDLKARFHALPEDVAFGAAQLGKLVKQFDYGPAYPAVPDVLLVSPIHLAKGVEHSIYTGFAPESYRVSTELTSHFKKHAEENGFLFLDASVVAKPSDKDKLHMEQEDHAALAKAIASCIRKEWEISRSG